MERFLSILFIVIIVIFLLRWLCLLLAPWLMKLLVKRVQKDFGAGTFSGNFGSFGSQPNQDESPNQTTSRARASSGADGEIFLKVHRKPGQSLSDLLGGDVVQFEEINDPIH